MARSTFFGEALTRVLVVAGLSGVLSGCGKGDVDPPPPAPDEPPGALEPAPTPTVVTTAAPPLTTTAPSVDPARSETLEKAREAGLRGDFVAVRQLLETRVRSGHATVEEMRLVREACKVAGDRACVEDIRAKYPS